MIGLCLCSLSLAVRGNHTHRSNVCTDIKFILLHQHKHEEGIRQFLMDVWELWVKVCCHSYIIDNHCRSS